MAEPAPPAQIIRFGSFEVDVCAGELRKNGLKLKVQELPFRALVLLLQRSGEVVTREGLRSALWPTDVFVDFDRGIGSTINRLRDSLGDSAKSPRYIQTVGRRGYRWIGPITPADGAAVPSGVPLQANSLGEVIKPQGFARARRIAQAAGTVLLILLAAVGFLRWRENRNDDAPIRSVAVLPLQNLSGDREQEYLTDGMTDELITDLAKLGALRVISHTSVMRYLGAQNSLPEIARELNVDAIVEGTVQSSPGRIHVSAQLVRAQPEKHLWAESYDRSLGDMVALQEELAREIAGAIRISLTPQQQVQLRRNVSPDVYDLYLKGRYFWNRRTEEGLTKAIEYFNQTIAKDPDYALAYSGLADSYNLLHFYGGTPPEELVPKARAAARKALELDDHLAEAHTSLAYLTHRFDWDWAAAEAEYKRALDLNPNYATAHHWYAEYLMVRGRFAEAQEQIRRAKEVDPLSLEINTDEGLPFYFTRQYDRAIEKYVQVVQMDPSFAPAHFALRDAYELKGMHAEAIQEFRKGVGLSGGSEAMVEPVARAFAETGPQGYWRKRLDLALRGPKQLRATPTQIANLYSALGDKQRALDWLEKAYNTRDDELVWLAVEPWHDRLRSEPRFADLLRRVDLAP